ncbi:MAG: hypothetical protein NC432_12860 [Roseburia sp.]|nr:hypothetical protein [Roseburia sp.]MCM1099557.1 hypothetical protein [Ruminococcus flavefaciens]
MKKTLIIPLICVLLVVAVVIGFAVLGGKKPYKDFDSTQIVSATVHLVPPDKTLQIVEIEELVTYLKDVVIYNKDNSYTEYDGQGVTFTLTMTDGTQISIMAYNPFLVIDGVGYRTKYEPCEVLNGYANRLLDAEDAVVILEKPPALDVTSDNTCIDTLLGSYSWQCKNNDGTFTSMEAGSAHPLDCADLLLPFETTETNASLRFTEEPDTILSARCWSDEHWSDLAADSEAVSVTGNEIELKAGGYIYEVTAEWNTEKSGYGGIAHYCFYIRVLE